MTLQNKKENCLRIAVVMGKYTTGGIKSVIMNYAKHMDREKICFDLLIDDDSPLKDYSDIEALGGKVFLVPAASNPFAHVRAVYKILKEHHYLCVHGYVNTLNVFPMLAGKLAKTPVRIAENLSTAHPSEKKTFFKNILKPMATWFPNAIAANSEYAAHWLYGKKAAQSEIIRNALDLDNYTYNDAARAAVRAKLGLEDHFVLGHIGRYEYQKNHEFLIDIFHRVHQKNAKSRLLLVGYGSLKEAIFAKIESLNLQDAVIDMGLTEDILPLYSTMDCFVLPSFYEGLPVVGIEAQATGLPCVMSSEVTEEAGVTDLVNFIEISQSAEYWAEAILRWQGHKRTDTKAELGQKGYNIKIEAKRLEDYYIQLVQLNTAK